MLVLHDEEASASCPEVLLMTAAAAVCNLAAECEIVSRHSAACEMSAEPSEATLASTIALNFMKAALQVSYCWRISGSVISATYDVSCVILSLASLMFCCASILPSDWWSAAYFWMPLLAALTSITIWSAVCIMSMYSSVSLSA